MKLIQLFLAVLIWGSTFTVVGDAMRAWHQPFTFMSVRFGLAAVVFLPFLAWRYRGGWEPAMHHAKPALIAGTWLFVGFAAQKVALVTSSATTVAFVFAFSAILVPIGAAAIYGDRLRGAVWAGLAVAGGGIAVALSDLKPGDLWALASAVGLAGYLLTVSKSRYAKKQIPNFHAPTFTMLVLLTVFAFGTLTSWVVEMPNGIPMPPSRIWLDMAFAVLLASCAAFLLHISAARHVPAAPAALIFALEPIIAAATDYLFLGSTGASWVACALILAGVLVVELDEPLGITEKLRIMLPRFSKTRPGV